MHHIPFEYGSFLHRTAAEMLDAIVYDYITAGARNSAEEVSTTLATTDDEALLADMIRDFGLGEVMERDEIGEAEALAALARFRAAHA